MPVVALASSKGGCGKSTTALILASAILAAGYKVRIIDADRSARLVRWDRHGTESGSKPAEVSVIGADEKTLRAEIERGKKEADIVIIDVEGSANMSVALAIGHADAVIVPANPSAPDVEDAIATVALIRDTEGMLRRPIPHGLLWSRVPSAIRSREFAALEEQVEQGGIPVLGRIVERTAYKSLFSYATLLGQLPSKDVPGLDKARDEANRLAEAVVSLIHGSRSDTDEPVMEALA
jgi:chromosome partitioning protein